MRELYDKLVEAGEYTQSFEQFKKQWGSDEESYQELHDGLVEAGDYTGDFERFKFDYEYEPVKIEAVVEVADATAENTASTDSTLENGSLESQPRGEFYIEGDKLEYADSSFISGSSILSSVSTIGLGGGKFGFSILFAVVGGGVGAPMFTLFEGGGGAMPGSGGRDATPGGGGSGGAPGSGGSWAAPGGGGGGAPGSGGKWITPITGLIIEKMDITQLRGTSTRST